MGSEGKRGVRIETDSFGPIEVPSEKLYGANTARSIINFKIGDKREQMPVSSSTPGSKILLSV